MQEPDDLSPKTSHSKKSRLKIRTRRTVIFFYRTPCTHPFGRPSADERQGPSFPRKRHDGFDLARCSRTKRPKRPTDEGNVEGERICGARLMVRRSMNPILLTPLPPSVSPRPIISQTPPLFGRGRTTSSDCSTEVVRVRSHLPGVLSTRL